jgi:TM2 domain-containing membrane protein YozV
VNKKSRTIYVVLAIFLGHIGVHNFYAGYIGRGVAQLLITILTFGFLFWISWIWAIIEACAETHDGRSIPFV